jgi:hypothetical protein
LSDDPGDGLSGVACCLGTVRVWTGDLLTHKLRLPRRSGETGKVPRAGADQLLTPPGEIVVAAIVLGILLLILVVLILTGAFDR